MYQRSAVGFVAVAVGLTLGCGSQSETYQIMVAAIAHGEDPEVASDFRVPDVVPAGASFRVEFLTVGLSGCFEPLYEEVEPRENGLRITPYDKDFSADCNLITEIYPRAVDLVLEHPGKYVVELRGKVELWPGAEEVSIERLVTVE